MNDKQKAHLILAVSIVIFLSFSAWLFNGLIDDAFIVFRYSENLAKHGQLTWNLGEAPVEGYSNPIGMLLMAFAIYIGLDPVFWSQIIGIIFGLMTIVLLYFVSLKFTNDRVIAALPSFLLSLTPPFARWAVGGLSTTMMSFSLLFLLHFLVQDLQKKGVSFKSVISLIFLSLVRTEGVVIAGIVLLPFIYLKRKELRAVLKKISLFIIVYALYFAARYIYYGHILTGPSYAKTGMLAGLSYSVSFMLYISPFLLLFAVGLLATKGRISPQRSMVLAFLTAVILANINVKPHMVTFFRMFVPVIPLAYILAIPSGFSLQKLKGFGSYVPVALVLLILVGSSISGGFQKLETRHNVKAHATSSHHGWEMVHGEIGRAFSTLNPDYSVALADAGMIPYYSKMKVIDYFGLNDYYLGKNKDDYEKLLDYLFSKRPEIILTNPHVIKGNEFELDSGVQSTDYIALKKTPHSAIISDPRFSDYIFVKAVLSPDPRETYPLTFYHSTYVYTRKDVADEVALALADINGNI